MVNQVRMIFSLSFVLLVLVPSPAYAYLDPGTGSIIFQAVVGSILAAFFALKQWGARIKLWFNSKFKNTDDGSN